MSLFVIYSSTSEKFEIVNKPSKPEAIEHGKQSGGYGIGFVDAVKLVDLPEIKAPGKGLTDGLAHDDPQADKDRKKEKRVKKDPK